MSLHIHSYKKFESNAVALAANHAEKLINDFEKFLEGKSSDVLHTMRITYTTSQSKCVEEYTLLKVFHMLKSSGCFIDYKVVKLKYGSRVNLTIQVSVPDSDDESECSDGCSLCCPEELQEDPITTS
jgi:hypothetical protein